MTSNPLTLKFLSLSLNPCTLSARGQFFFRVINNNSDNLPKKLKPGRCILALLPRCVPRMSTIVVILTSLRTLDFILNCRHLYPTDYIHKEILRFGSIHIWHLVFRLVGRSSCIWFYLIGLCIDFLAYVVKYVVR